MKTFTLNLRSLLPPTERILKGRTRSLGATRHQHYQMGGRSPALGPTGTTYLSPLSLSSAIMLPISCLYYCMCIFRFGVCLAVSLSIHCRSGVGDGGVYITKIVYTRNSTRCYLFTQFLRYYNFMWHNTGF